ncbi:MAG: ATP-binding protein [Armatimonadetes bacterium]|nr:ATP-binding protein [Armatimonadota bacterium]
MPDLNLPHWAQDIKEKYEAREASQFLLYGNVLDVVPCQGKLLWLREFLTQALTGGKRIVAYFNLSEGLTFATKEMQEDFGRFIDVYWSVTGGLPGVESASLIKQRPQFLKDPRVALPLLEELLGMRDKVVILLDHVEKIVPATQLSSMSMEDRRNLATLQRWAVHPAFHKKDNAIILISRNLADVHRDLRETSPLLDTVEISFPDAEERLEFIQFRLKENPAAKLDETLVLEMPPERFAALTAGFNRVAINGFFQQAERTGRPITLEAVKNRKDEIFKEEYGGLVEVLDPDFGIDMIGGMETIKEDLRAIVDLMKEGKRSEVPMGIGLIGPPGTGKTMIGKALAKETNLPFLKLGNIRDKFVGESEKNADQVITLLRSLAPVVVFVDEIDQAFGSRGERGDSGVSQRIWAKFSEIQSDTSYRGLILWIWATNRPDIVDEATKRPGRLGDLKIPFFHSTEVPEIVLRVSAKKNGIHLEEFDFSSVLAKVADYSGAELEAVMLQARWFARRAGRESVGLEDLLAAYDDYMPSRNERMISFMEVLAMLEASSKRLIPAKYLEKYDRAELALRGQQLRRELSAEGLL